MCLEQSQHITCNLTSSVTASGTRVWNTVTTLHAVWLQQGQLQEHMSGTRSKQSDFSNDSIGNTCLEHGQNSLTSATTASGTRVWNTVTTSRAVWLQQQQHQEHTVTTCLCCTPRNTHLYYANWDMKNTIRTHHMQSDFSSGTDSIRNTPLEHILSQSSDLLGDISRPNSPSTDLLGDISRANSPSRDLLGDVSRPNSQSRDLLGDVSRPNSQSTDSLGDVSRPNSQSRDLLGDVSRPNSQSRDLLGDVSRPNSQPRDSLGDVSRANFDKLLLQKDQLFHSVDIELWVVLALLVHILKPLSVTALQEPSHARYEVLQQDKHSLLTFCGMERNCSTRITSLEESGFEIHAYHHDRKLLQPSFIHALQNCKNSEVPWALPPTCLAGDTVTVVLSCLEVFPNGLVIFQKAFAILFFKTGTNGLPTLFTSKSSGLPVLSSSMVRCPFSLPRLANSEMQQTGRSTSHRNSTLQSRNSTQPSLHSWT